MATTDLLTPPSLRGNYIHQLRQTVQAYSATQMVIGEALQNAIDAVVEAGGGRDIQVELDFDARSVVVRDHGIGFPNDPKLLFLGGTGKQHNPKNLFGLIGVGMKVVIFNSDNFVFQTRRDDDDPRRFAATNAYRFEASPPPSLPIDDETFDVDPDPLAEVGTRVEYRFPAGTATDPIARFIDEMRMACLESGVDQEFGKTLAHTVEKKVFPSRFAVLMTAYLRRYLYAGDVLHRLGKKKELQGTRIHFTIRCSDPSKAVGDKMGALFDGQVEVRFEVSPLYLLAEDTIGWVPTHAALAPYAEQLGPGGKNLIRTAHGINTLHFDKPEEYERLVTNAQRNLPEAIEEYRQSLFPRINGIILTIGHIPHLEQFLPGGSRRILSANGVVTSHSLEISSARNQQYVRCLDLVIDLDADLNYGKSQITDRHLIGRARRFIDDAYRMTLHPAAENFVGTIHGGTQRHDVFVQRPGLGVDDLILQKEPRDENDVIALFFELAGRGLFPGYRILGLSQSDQYDGRAVIQRVGDSQPPAMPTDDRQAQVVEFKRTAASIVRELASGEKVARDMDLLIAWDQGRSDSPYYTFAEIAHSGHYPKQVFPRVQAFLRDSRSGAEVQLLLLQPIIEELRAEAAAAAAEESTAVS